MDSIKLPYYNTSLDLPTQGLNIKAVLTSQQDSYQPEKSQAALVADSLANPIGTQPLCDLAKDKNNILLITSDHTRAMPSKITLPLLLQEMRRFNEQAGITILIATGLHRPTTVEEQIKMFGEDIVKNEHIVVHDAFKQEDMEYICQLPSGAVFEVNRLVTQSDLIVCEGFIEPHFFAGFSGGRKSLLPGVCSEKTVNMNHSFSAIAHSGSKGGVLSGNIIHEDMLFAAKKAGVSFILNVALNAEKEIIASFAGDVEAAHQEGCAFVTRLSKIDSVQGDIVITSNGGYPLDQNLYQCPKALATAQSCAKEKGVIIMAASCCDGIGGTHFEKLLLSGTPQEIYNRLKEIPPGETIPEQWCAQILSQILLKHTVIIVTTYLDASILKKAGITPASSLEEAIALAQQMKGGDAEVVVIPDGVSVIAV